MKAVEQFADNDEITISQFQIDNVPVYTLSSSSKIYSYGFNVSASGRYPSITSFISHLLHWKRIVTISALTFSKEISTPGANLKLTLRGTAYYEP